jgi:trimeric autotransporter adhesin
MNTNLKSLVLAIMLAMPVVALSAGSATQGAGTSPNNVYIEQIGNSNTVTIEQVGGSNNVGGVDSVTPSSTNYATINGSSNGVTMTQTGDNNLGQYKILGSNNTYTSTVTGYDNKTKLTIGNTNNATNLRNTVTETIIGDTNTVVQTIVGNDNNSSLAITGNRNEVTKEITSSSAINDVTISGNDNKLYSQQIGSAGAAGHELVLNSSGDYNTYSVQQQGTNDTTVNIQTTGSHNTVTVRTSNTAIVNPLTAVAR